jgi:hypothetical protein
VDAARFVRLSREGFEGEAREGAGAAGKRLGDIGWDVELDFHDLPVGLIGRRRGGELALDGCDALVLGA